MNISYSNRMFTCVLAVHWAGIYSLLLCSMCVLFFRVNNYLENLLKLRMRERIWEMEWNLQKLKKSQKCKGRVC